MKITAVKNSANFVRKLQRIEKNTTYAAMRALNDTGFDVRRAVQGDLKQRLDRPTRYTLGAIYVTKATRSIPIVTVGLKGANQSRSQAVPQETIGQQFIGGRRQRKGMEKALTSLGLIGPSEFVVPGKGAVINQYGNISLAQTRRMIRELRGTGRKRSGSGAQLTSNNAMFWSDGKHGLSRGVFRALPNGGLLAVATVHSPPRYRQRLNVRRVGERVARRVFSGHMRRNLVKALSS